MIRFGLCCIFRNQQIHFRQTTAAALLKYERGEQLRRLSQICKHNLDNLLAALQWVDRHKTGAFRVLSPLFPRYTHPDVGYRLEELPGQLDILKVAEQIRNFRVTNDIRLSLHPDQFNVLSSPHENVIENTCRELEYQGYLAELLDIEVINIHGGGKYSSKRDALARFRENFANLSDRVQSRLTVENDDRTYTPADLLPLCNDLHIPLVYDIHHHRCLTDGMDEKEATENCMASWQSLGREPFFHISSPKNGWQAKQVRQHADYIDLQDFPNCWRDLNCTIDVEAKAKELAVLKLKKFLSENRQ